MVKASALYGGIEAGGTKFVCAVGSGPENILAKTQFPTTSPPETLARAVSFFKEAKVPLKAVGIASFGPLDLDKKSPAFGSITTTPKPGWTNTNLVKNLRDALGVPVVIDTDVNGAALGEWRWGRAQGLDTFIYLTIGTGIGGGGMVGGKLMHGLMHPEMGHILIPHDLQKDPFSGSCPFHGDCLEGLARSGSGKAVGRCSRVAACGSSGMAIGNYLPGTRNRGFYFNAFPAKSYPWRRHHESPGLAGKCAKNSQNTIK